MPSQRKPNQSQLLKKLIKNLLNAGRIAVIGVGSPLRGDDVAGVAVTELIRKSKKRPSFLKAFIGCTAPENITGEVIKFLGKKSNGLPHILFVDAAQMDLKPGSVCILETNDIEGTSFSTHVLPLAILISYFQQQIKCKISVIGIQPENTDFGISPSVKVLNAVKSVADDILYAATHGKVLKLQ